MGKFLYEKTETGGISFVSQRKMGDVRIPNYVYDIWLPIIGTRGIAVYGVFCRLEREGTVKAITLADIAKACRIGPNSLSITISLLCECGFITYTPPTGQGRLMHWTSEIVVLDPPKEVSGELVEKYAHPQGYQPLSVWLVTPELLDSKPGVIHQYDEDLLDSKPKIESLSVESLDVVEECANAPTPILSEDEAGAREFEELFGTGAPTALECVVIAPFTARDLQTEEGRERAQAHLLRSRRLTVENEPWQIWGHCPTLSEYSPPVEISRTFVLQAISLLMQAGVPLDLQKKSEVRFWISSVESIGRKCGWEIGVVEQALARALQAGLSIKGPQSIDYAIADIMVKAQQAQNGGVIAGGDGGMITAIRKVTD